MTASNAHVKNVLFIMADQLRWDYLACAGHPTIKTPNIDALARKGMRFANAFVQGSVCGPSRMSAYTGRYVTSHGANWNFVPLSLAQKTLGNHLHSHGVRCAVTGKTHIEPDMENAERLGIDTTSPSGILAMQGGFEPYDRDDGILPPGFKVQGNQYCEYLREKGYASDNPWQDFANSSLGEDGSIHSGWQLRWANEPARVDKDDSESAYMTNRAMDFISDQGDEPWLLHLSYIKPHWPYVAPDPYHAMYTPQDILGVNRHSKEKDDPHPVYTGFMNFQPSKTFSRDGVREIVVPTYMGLISQLDEQIGRMMAFLERTGKLDETLIVFTSDHGDYLGDHWLGEKEMFHDTAVKVPMIIVDPSEQANATRGTTCDEIVEMIDLIPTFLDSLALPKPRQWLEGQSLLPILHGSPDATGRAFAVCENTFAFRDCVRLPMGAPVDRCNMTMVRTHEWKYIHVDRERPMLFNLRDDPQEINDLGGSPKYSDIRAEMQRHLLDWLFCRKRSPTVSQEKIESWNKREAEIGIDIGVW